MRHVCPLILALSVCIVSSSQAAVWPENDINGWPTGTPESQGMSTTLLQEASGKMKTPIGTALVIRNGYDVWHFGDPYRHAGNVSSVERSMLLTLYGIAIDDGVIKGGLNALEQPVQSLGTTTAKTIGSNILLKHLLSYTSCANPPGSGWSYSCKTRQMTDIFCELYGQSYSSSCSQKATDLLCRPLGGQWVSYWDAAQHELKFNIGAADMCRWGYLMINNGKWKDTHLIDSGFVDVATQPFPSPNGGYANINECWQIHCTAGGRWVGLPKDSHAALGAAATKVIFVCPSLNLVVGRIGIEPKEPDRIDEFIKPIVDAVTGQGTVSALPPKTAVRQKPVCEAVVYDMRGKAVARLKAGGAVETTLRSRALPVGAYVVRAYDTIAPHGAFVVLSTYRGH